MNDRDQHSGDSDRLAHWVREHGHAVRGYLMGILRRPDVVDDLVQEVFWRAWKSRNRYQETGAGRAYLLKIADRLACDYCRTAAREIHLDEEGWDQVEPVSDVGEPPEHLAWDESRRHLAEALGALSPSQRRVLLLRYYGDLDFREIAQVCERPLGTVLSHCHRGLRTLRTLLAEKTP